MERSESFTLFNLEGARSRTRGYSSAGRAPALQAGGQRFDPVYLHHPEREKRRLGRQNSREYGLIAQPVRAHA